MQLADRIAIITGADSGIGQAAAAAFAEAGADVCITYNTDEEGAAATRGRVEAAGRRALVLQTDIGDPAAVDALFARTAEALGPPDILVANAGVGMGGMP